MTLVQIIALLASMGIGKDQIKQFIRDTVGKYIDEFVSKTPNKFDDIAWGMVKSMFLSDSFLDKVIKDAGVIN